MRYYIDTAIWIDAVEDRRGFNGEPLGEAATKLLAAILDCGDEIVVSDLLLFELGKRYCDERVSGMLAPYQRRSISVHRTEQQRAEARSLAQNRKVPVNDAIHAILARDYDCILVTRDRHFLALRDICPSYKPEEPL